MAGVEILTSAQVVVEVAFNWTVFWIAFSIMFLLCLIAYIGFALSTTSDFVGAIPILIVGLVFGTIFGVGFGEMASKPISYETQYKVTISDEVSMTEFYKHYEVIEQDGKIFTVKEKTND